MIGFAKSIALVLMFAGLASATAALGSLLPPLVGFGGALAAWVLAPALWLLARIAEAVAPVDEAPVTPAPAPSESDSVPA